MQSVIKLSSESGPERLRDSLWFCETKPLGAFISLFAKQSQEVLCLGVQASPAIVDKVNKAIQTIIGKIARPKQVHIVPGMPKTRSGKLMRRIPAALSTT